MDEKDWLEKLKPIIDIQIENDSHYGRPAQVTLYSTDINRLVEQAELTQYFAGKNAKLNEFLNDYAAAGDLGRNVIDVAMRIIKEQDEQVQELDKALTIENRLHVKANQDANRLDEQVSRYREAMYKAIDRSNAGKVLGHIDSQVAKILREALEDSECDS